ncbi:MAG: diacylglycerol/lipid kinase family protein [Pseudomonadota bacterium]|uniref:Diacylglycerol/lipid kinase family protein n=1 Tax=Phenylobacterium conjunctum TaxID=1298959 RepID=A0ABW3T3U1_9CAUL|nr:diacylglycerol kinase family protein [Phenylobacterium zucineum]
MPSDLDLRSLRIGVLLNTSSGSCDSSTRGAVLSVLETAEVEPVQVWDVVGKGVDRALDQATESGLDVMVVLGGDGTIRAAAQRCEAEGPLLMPLPGGTMNMLPKALYGARTWREALTDTLAAPIVQAVHGGQVGGHRFYVAGVFGGASLFAEAREAIRDGDLPAAWEQGVAALKQALGAELRYRFEGKSASKAEAVVVLCPLPPPETDGEVLLEAAAIDVDGAGDAIRLAVMSAFRGWRADETVTLAHLESLEIASSRPIPAILDGERFTLTRSERVTRVRGAFYALKPAPPAWSA